MDFYKGGGNFDRTTNPSMATGIVPLNLTQAQAKSLLAFLLSLTNDRVRFEQAPFDHPGPWALNGANADGTDHTSPIQAVGAAGLQIPARLLALSPFAWN